MMQQWENPPESQVKGKKKEKKNQLKRASHKYREIKGLQDFSATAIVYKLEPLIMFKSKAHSPCC